MSRLGAWKNERGFTLVEVLLVVILMGLVLAIASSSWFGAIEGQKVDSATNQVAADLRFAHSQATNRLAYSEFVYPDPTPPAGAVVPSTYEIGPAGAFASDKLPDGTRIGADTTIRFNPDGTAQVMSGPAVAGGIITVTVGSSIDTTNNHNVEINTATSRVRVVP